MTEICCKEKCGQSEFCGVMYGEVGCYLIPGYTRDGLYETCNQLEYACGLCEEEDNKRAQCQKCQNSYEERDDFCVKKCGTGCEKDEICYNGICESCPAYFKPTHDNTYCELSCPENMLPDEEGISCCKCSIDNCEACESNSGCDINCAKCKEHFILNVRENECIPENDCKTYNKLPSENKLLCCDCSSVAHCVACSNDHSVCDVACYYCEVGYVEFQGKCIEQECEIYTLDMSQCGSCAAVENCGFCFNENISKCAKCEPGYFLSPSGELCDLCEDAGQLPSQSERYCGNCNYEERCKTCLDSNLYLCAECQDDYVMNGLQKCVNCEGGLLPVENNTRCGTCSFNVENCRKCSNINDTMCALCRDGYYLDGLKCVLCSTMIEFCDVCSDSTTCAACERGFFMENGVCTECELPCSTCASLSACESCSLGYTLFEEECLECAKGCANCDGLDLQLHLCNECILGYELIDGVCTKMSCGSVLEGCKHCGGEYPDFNCKDSDLTMTQILMISVFCVTFLAILIFVTLFCRKNKIIIKCRKAKCKEPSQSERLPIFSSFISSPFLELSADSMLNNAGRKRKEKKHEEKGVQESYLASPEQLEGI